MADAVVPVRYRPHDPGYRLSVEVFDAAELRSRVAAVPGRGFERADFQTFVFVRSGSYHHTVDFEMHECTPGSCLLIRPGQVHRFGPPSEWDGWIVVADAEHVPPAVMDLPQHVRLDPATKSSVSELLSRMAADARLEIDRPRLDALLALQIRVLTSRLEFGVPTDPQVEPIDPNTLMLVRHFRALVELRHADWHLVPPYADQLGCSVKSLDRACRAATAMSAKRVIVERIVLEAKRLLAHSDLAVATISRRLGFDEPTNFVKYVRRETGSTPAQFRARVRTPQPR